MPSEYGGGNAKVIAWLWARTVKCPNPGCGRTMPLLSTFVLSSKKGKEAYLNPIIEGAEIKFDVSSVPPTKWKDPKKGYKRGKSGIFECPFCADVTTRDYVAEEANKNRLGQIQTAVVVKGNRGRIYLPMDFSPIPKDIPQANKDGLEVQLQPNPRDVWCRNFGLNTPADLFTNRQLVSLDIFSSLIGELQNIIVHHALANGMSDDATPLKDGGIGSAAYAEAIRVYLGFVVDKVADYWSSVCSWHSSGEKMRNTFGRQAIPMVWDYAEANPFSSSTGNWLAMVNWVWKVVENLPSSGVGEETQNDAQTLHYLDGAVVSTDPPYYDNIAYSDLSDFFYVWMRRTLSGIYPDLFSTLVAPKNDELVALPYRHGGKDEADNFFLKGMTNAISNLASQTRIDYPTTIYYAFKQSEINQEGLSSTGWVTFLQAIMNAGYSIVGTWPMRTEMTARMVASGTNALATSVVLVCRKREIAAETVTRAEFIRALKKELPSALLELQKANITPVDMPQASIGPGIGVFSRYKTVLESDDSPMTVKTALQIINRELDVFLTEQEGEFDADTRFAVTWFEQNGMKAGKFGDADNLARARGLSVDSVKHAGIVESSAGKVRLLGRDELEDDWTPATDTHLTVWECTQYLIRALQNDGEYAAAVLLKQMGSENADAARDLAYRLFDICDKQEQAKEAGAYNSLIAVWSDLTAQAATVADADLNQEQLNMF